METFQEIRATYFNKPVQLPKHLAEKGVSHVVDVHRYENLIVMTILNLWQPCALSIIYKGNGIIQYHDKEYNIKII